MSDLEIDKGYLNENFVKLINNADEEKFVWIFTYILDNYNDDVGYNQILNFSKIISSLLNCEVDSTLVFRQIKYLINKGVYSRLSKKFKNDLLALQISSEKTEKIVDLIKNYLEKLNEINKTSEHKQRVFNVKDFNIKTHMPVYTSNYYLKKDQDTFNEDSKKQNTTVSMKLQCNGSSKEDLQNLTFEMDKCDLMNFYEVVEKIQENLDKLY